MAADSQQIERVFTEALSQPDAPARVCYLDKACASNVELRQRVENLLAAHDATANFLKLPGNHSAAFAPVSEGPGSKIGRYKLLEQIGEGGFGVVFMAEQEESLQRRVALKIIKLGMDTKQVVARFEAERQALAMMDHPNIAKVLDAGATETGRPYFVMELVKGISITEYCDQAELTPAERLSLFVAVCHAVQHAHQKGIIHRDLKPSNILVTPHDDKAVPKIIDFGIAKATQARLTEKTLFTEFRQMIGTPAYMSPEQAQVSGLDIDTRTDIYSLGVLLYELLTGSTPFSTKELLSAGYAGMQRIITEKDPPPPSTRLLNSRDSLLSISAQRQTEPAKLTRLLRVDLDWIVMRCLEKDRSRRYETALGLAEDVERHLSDQPVEARRPTRWYRLTKFIRCNKLGVLAGSAIVAALVVGLVLASIGFIWARQQEEIARMQAARSEQVAEFLKDMLQGVGPSVAQGRDTTLLREILEKTAQRVGNSLKDQPEVEAELRSIIGNAYIALGEGPEAEAMHRLALTIFSHLPSNENRQVAELLDALANDVSYQQRHVEAEALERNSLAMWRKLLGNENLRAANSLNNLAGILIRQAQGAPVQPKQGKLAEAEALEREALAIRKRLLGNEHLDVAQSLDALALTLYGQEKLAEAETLEREALAMRKRLLGDGHLLVAMSLINLADMLVYEDKFAEAEPLFREALGVRMKMCGEDHPDVAYALDHLAVCVRGEGRLAEAEILERQALAIRRKAMREEDPFVAITLNSLAEILRDQGKLAEAENMFREAWNIRSKTFGNKHSFTVQSFKDLIDVLQREEKTAEADELQREATKLIELRAPDKQPQP